MAEVKDPKIKLFGKTIGLPDTSGEATETAVAVAVAAPSMIGGVGLVQSCDAAAGDSALQDPPSSSNSVLEDCSLNRGTVTEEQESHKSLSGPKLDDVNKEDHDQPLTSGELKDCDVPPPMNEDLLAPSPDSDAGAGKTSKTEEDQSETSNSQEKTLKKPDKILPCPRCNSMDTKFCYFNNYNVNQPRHFCKNCQRYWTAGGTMRNVPVGAGRRKNKNAACQFRHLTVQEALQSARVELPNGIHHPSLNPNGSVGTVLAFSSDSPQPLCESMASVLNIADKTIKNSSRNGFNKPEELRSPVSHGVTYDGDNHSSGTSTTTTTLKDEVGKTVLSEAVVPNCHTFPQIPCFPGPPWPYPWNSVPWSSPLSPPTFGAASFPLPVYATAPPYWGCAVPGTWNVPWVITPTASQNHTPPSSGPNSPTLGKHSRDDNILKPADGKETETQKDSNSEKFLWVPKTLRIDDMGEAAKSSIWATLGIKIDAVDSAVGGGLFKALSKGDEKTHVAETSTVLQANPAALSRSLSFHESS